METTKKGKYAGECPKCNLVLIEGETSCVRCGATFPAAEKKTFDNKVEKSAKCDCEDDCICKCK